MSTHVESIGCVRECETEVELPWAANSCPCVVEAANRVTIYCWCPETVRCSWCLSSVASSAQHKHGPVRIIVSARSLCLPGRLIKRVCSGVGGWGCDVAWKDSRHIGRGARTRCCWHSSTRACFSSSCAVSSRSFTVASLQRGRGEHEPN
jgi:hypothetical protein